MWSSHKETGLFVPQCTVGASALGTEYSFNGYAFYLAPGKIARPGYHDVFALAIQDLSRTPANDTYAWFESFVISRSNTPLLDLVKSQHDLDIKKFLLLNDKSTFPLCEPVYVITDPEAIIHFYAFIGSKIKEVLSPLLEDLLENVTKKKSESFSR